MLSARYTSEPALNGNSVGRTRVGENGWEGLEKIKMDIPRAALRHKGGVGAEIVVACGEK